MASFTDTLNRKWRMVFDADAVARLKAAGFDFTSGKSINTDKIGLLSIIVHLCAKQAEERGIDPGRLWTVIRGREPVAALHQALAYYRAGQRQRVE